MANDEPSVLIIGAGMLQVPLIQLAQAMGLYAIAVDGNPQAPGASVANHFYTINTYAAQSVCALASGLQGVGWNLQGVCTAGADVAHTVAAVASQAALPGIPEPIARRLRDKGEVRQLMDAYDLTAQHQPRWAMTPREAVAETIDAQIGYPCVVKPVGLRASRGVTIVRSPADLDNAMTRLQRHDPEGTTALVEAYHTGTEYSVECVLDGYGLPLAWNESQRFFTYAGGVPIELGHLNPPRGPRGTLLAMREVVLATARACGVTWGPWKNDLLVDADDQVWVLECCARLSGGWDCQRTQPLARGVSLMQPMLKQACGLPIELDDITPTRDWYAACHAIIPNRTGRLRDLGNYDPARVVWHAQVGDQVALLEHNAQRLGFVFTEGTTAYAWTQGQRDATRIAATLGIDPIA